MESVEQQHPSQTEKGSTRMQFIAAISATLGYVVGGTFLTWPSPTIPKLQEEGSPIPITNEQGAWLASILSIGLVLAPLPTGYIVDAVGRKSTLAFLGLPFIACWLVVIFAQNVTTLYIIRFLEGLFFGVCSTIGPIYTMEIAEDRIRGTLGTIFQVMINLGVLFEYSVGPYVSYRNLGYASMVFPVLFMLTVIWMPESPYFFIMRGRREDAEKSLLRLRGKKLPESVKEELDSIQTTIDIQSKEKGSFRDLVGSRGNMRALLLLLGLLAFQHLSGIIPMLSFANIIFEENSGSIDPKLATIIFGVVQLLFSLVSSGLVDRAGRRPLLIMSTLGCAITLLVVGLYLYLSPEDSTKLAWLPVTFMYLYIIVYIVGLGPLPWAVAGEIFPSNIKGIAISLASIANGLYAFVVTKLFQVISDGQGQYLAFWIFAACCALGTVYIFIFIPETKGKSFLQIQEEINPSSKTSTDVANKEKNQSDERDVEKY